MPQHLSFISLGIPFIELQSVDSTNNYALSQIHNQNLPDAQNHVQHGTAFFAHEQVAGKGQRNKNWNSEKGANLILSIALQPQFLKVSEQFQLSACIAVSVHDFFSQYAGDETKIKWPNDLYWNDRKAGGILIENIIRKNESDISKWEWAVAGIGININQTSFPDELKNPVSLKQITGKNFDAVSLAKELCKITDGYYHELMNGHFAKIYSYYLEHLYKKNEKVKLKKDNRIFDAVIKEVSPSGQIIVQHAIEEQFEFGEVEWL